MPDGSLPRAEIRVQAAKGDWPHPWPNVAEIGMGGSDRSRIRTLAETLPDDHPAWLPLGNAARANAQAALRILGSA
jgi:hypothetical protein